MAVGYLGFELVQNAPLFIPGSSEGQWITLNFLPARLLNIAFERTGFFAGLSKDSNKWTVLNAYPVINGQRTLPVPVSWKQAGIEAIESGGRDESIEFEISYHDLSAWSKKAVLANEQGMFTGLPAFENKYGSVNRMFFAVEEDEDGEILNFELPVMNISPDLDRNQRPVVCLSAGNRFRGLVKIDASTQDDLNAIAKQLRGTSGDLFVGRRRNAGFGGRLTVNWDAELQDFEGNFFQESKLTTVKEKQVVRLIFISRVVTKDDKCPADIVLESMGDFFDKVSVFTEEVNEKALKGQGRVWKEGSVVILTAKSDMPIEKLQELQHKGLGEFTNQGYGRFMVLKKAEEATEYGYWVTKTGADSHITASSAKAASVLRDRVVNSLIIRAADIYASRLTDDGFTGPLPDYALLIDLYNILTADGLKSLINRLSRLEPQQKKALNEVKMGNGNSLLTFITELSNGKVVSARDLDLDALNARKTVKGVRVSLLTGKRKELLMGRTVNRIAVTVIKKLLQTVLDQQAEGGR